jgi:formate dehydrogenase subunit beta
MNHRDMELKLRREARALLEQGKVDYIIGFEAGSLKFTTTPLITSEQEATSRLVINPFIVNNLSVFLTEVKGRVGVVVKGCDSRSLVSLMQDNKVARDDVVILGIPCSGIIDLSKVEKLVVKDRDEIADINRDGDRVVVTVDGSKKEFPASEVLFDNCLGCEFPTPQEYDILLGEPTSPPSDKYQAASLAKIKQLKDMPAQRRWEFWRNEFDRCLRCYACRNICPACFCQRCFVEESEPTWVLPVPRWQENLMFQVMRNIHVAGRCTDCGECERACPVNIPLRSLTREMYNLVDELFHYKPGMDKDASPFLAAYEATDTEDFIR